MEFMKVPCVSTAHLKPETARWLERNEHRLKETVLNYGFGYFIMTDSEYISGAYGLSGDVPEELVKLLDWMYIHGFYWIQVDESAEEWDEFPVFEWE